MLRLISLFFFLFYSCRLFAQFQAKECTNIAQVKNWVERYFVGEGIKILKVQYKGNKEAIGVFNDPEMGCGLKKGIVLSTGRVELINGNNVKNNTSTNFGKHFFFDEDLITSTSQCDGAVLEIDFIPQSDSICFNYCFGSEEYPEFVGKEFNDLFRLMIKPLFVQASYKNLAMLPDKKGVSINTINIQKNNHLFIDNSHPTSPNYEFIEFDGYTVPLHAGTRVAKNKPYRLKIIIVDLEDCEYDSGVLLEAYSLRSLTTKPVAVKPIYKNVYFNFANNSDTLSGKEWLKLKQLADSLRMYTFDSIYVIGHTDARGNDSSNQALSERRAAYIVNQFESLGVKCLHLKWEGKGSKSPLQNGNNNKLLHLNRRVELIFYRKSY
ncbi:MAG: choice-of-anchor L domain-containing protein [Bacteroidota bacterium]